VSESDKYDNRKRRFPPSAKLLFYYRPTTNDTLVMVRNRRPRGVIVTLSIDADMAALVCRESGFLSEIPYKLFRPIILSADLEYLFQDKFI
jgi:hypothetical protein